MQIGDPRKLHLQRFLETERDELAKCKRDLPRIPTRRHVRPALGLCSWLKKTVVDSGGSKGIRGGEPGTLGFFPDLAERGSQNVNPDSSVNHSSNRLGTN